MPQDLRAIPLAVVRSKLEEHRLALHTFEMVKLLVPVRFATFDGLNSSYPSCLPCLPSSRLRADEFEIIFPSNHKLAFDATSQNTHREIMHPTIQILADFFHFSGF